MTCLLAGVRQMRSFVSTYDPLWRASAHRRRHKHTHTHADLFKHMAPTQYARTRTHTHTDTYANYKSDNCRHDGALGEGEVKA